MTTTPTPTKRRKLNHSRGTSHLIGRRVAQATTDEGTLIGTIERFEGTRPIVRFPDGRWTYGDGHYVTLIED